MSIIGAFAARQDPTTESHAHRDEASTRDCEFTRAVETIRDALEHGQIGVNYGNAFGLGGEHKIDHRGLEYLARGDGGVGQAAQTLTSQEQQENFERLDIAGQDNDEPDRRISLTDTELFLQNPETPACTQPASSSDDALNAEFDQSLEMIQTAMAHGEIGQRHDTVLGFGGEQKISARELEYLARSNGGVGEAAEVLTSWEQRSNFALLDTAGPANHDDRSWSGDPNRSPTIVEDRSDMWVSMTDIDTFQSTFGAS